MRDTEDLSIVVPSAPAPSSPFHMGSNGATNFTRGEAQKFARSIIESKDYRDDLAARAKSGKLAPAIESMLWHYAYGKPIEQVQVQVMQGVQDFGSMSVEELQQALSDMRTQLEEAQALEDALPAQYKVG